MIKSFRHKGLKSFFFTSSKKGIQADHGQKIGDILDRLDAAEVISDMRFPGSDLHRLKGSLNQFWSIRVSGNWRIIFEFKDGDAYVVDYLDYH
ncbi:MAG: type II toxin-antitoxin system RelE/ParE family toxin [Elusimicrobiota bacterium]